MDSKRISLRIVGSDEDNGDVRFNDFIQQLDALKKALDETQKLYTQDKFAYFKVVELQRNSPALVVLEAVPYQVENETQTENLVDRFFQNLDDIQQGKYPSGFKYETFQAYKEIPSLREKKHIADIVISQNGNRQNNLLDFSANIKRIMGADVYEHGSYTGMLDAINIHNQNIFTVYPTSHLPKLKCVFPKDLRDDAIAAVGKYVTVTGLKKYKPNIRGGIPYEIEVWQIETHPPDNELPKLSDLKGIAPDATGDENSDEFIRGIRDEW